MMGNKVYYTAGAQHPPSLIKFDFYYMHCVNSSIFFPTFASLPSLSTAAKCRLLEWKGRIDLAMYASRHSPTILLDEITNYRPKAQGTADGGNSWENVFDRARKFEDDGHTSKLIRAIANGKKVSEKSEKEGRQGFRVRGATWDKLGQAAMDSVEAPGNHWVRSAGFEEAWRDVGERDVANL
jgi:Questin oxidase-like